MNPPFSPTAFESTAEGTAGGNHTFERSVTVRGKLSVGAGLAGQDLTRGDCAPLAGAQALPAGVFSVFEWTNDLVTDLGANLTGEIVVCTLPAGTLVRRALIGISGQAAGTGTLTVSLGRAGAAFDDYLGAANAQVAAGTIYGLAIAEIGTNLDPASVLGDIPSLSAATAVKLQFVATDGGAKKLVDVTGSSGFVVLETVRLELP